MANIDTSLSNIICNDDLNSLAKDFAQYGIDVLLKETKYANIPIVSCLAAIINAGKNISGYLFTRKLMSFLNELKDIPLEQRVKQIQKIDIDRHYRQKTGETLLFILDRCEDEEKARLIAFWFAEYLRENISYEDFRAGSHAINFLSVNAFQKFICGSRTYVDEVEYISAGLVFLLTEEPYLQKKQEYESFYDEDCDFKKHYEVVGGELSTMLTSVGSVLKKCFPKTAFNK